ncbi:MAG TPA: GNAT family N-acetyltransferase, partial [Acidimicrobiales bacterium]|nr:GNAT family N-acetyltransferase [Acidimicrobiales bacterium]
ALPNPGRQDPCVGYIQWMSTDPEWRRGGRSRAVLRALLEWFEASGVGMVELHASTMGEPLYRSAGFAESRWGTALRRHPLDQMAGKPVP